MAATTLVDGPTTRIDAPLRLRCEVIDALMKAKNVKSKAEQARRFGIAVTHWARIRSGEITPTLDTAMRIAAVAETSVEALWGRAA